jgi:hypothetical protein
MPTAGDVAALLGAARTRVRTARVVLADFTDPQATLQAWRQGPYADTAQLDNPGLLGLPSEPTTLQVRQWLDLENDRAREERGGVVLVKDGPRWWTSEGTSGEEPASTLELVDALRRWTDPQPLTRLMELQPAGETEVLGRSALLVDATARGETAYHVALAPLGWGAERWELAVDAELGVLLRTTAFVGQTPFRRVEAQEIAFDERFEDGLFAPPSGV